MCVWFRHLQKKKKLIHLLFFCLALLQICSRLGVRCWSYSGLIFSSHPPWTEQMWESNGWSWQCLPCASSLVTCATARTCRTSKNLRNSAQQCQTTAWMGAQRTRSMWRMLTWLATWRHGPSVAARLVLLSHWRYVPEVMVREIHWTPPQRITSTTFVTRVITGAAWRWWQKSFSSRRQNPSWSGGHGAPPPRSRRLSVASLTSEIVGEGESVRTRDTVRRAAGGRSRSSSPTWAFPMSSSNRRSSTRMSAMGGATRGGWRTRQHTPCFNTFYIKRKGKSLHRDRAVSRQLLESWTYFISTRMGIGMGGPSWYSPF